MPPRRERRVNANNNNNANQPQMNVVGKLLVDVELKGYNCKIPFKYAEQILNTVGINEIAVFNVAKTGLLVSISDYTYDDYTIYVSSEVFGLVKDKRSPKRGVLSIQRFYDYEKGEGILLEPLHTKFFDVKDQLLLLQDYICHNVRILYPKQEFEIYSDELQTILRFRVLMTNNTRYKVISAIDVDLSVDFDYKYINEKMLLPEELRDPFNMYIPSDGMRSAIDYVDAGLYNGKGLFTNEEANVSDDMNEFMNNSDISNDSEFDNDFSDVDD